MITVLLICLVPAIISMFLFKKKSKQNKALCVSIIYAISVLCCLLILAPIDMIRAGVLTKDCESISINYCEYWYDSDEDNIFTLDSNKWNIIRHREYLSADDVEIFKSKIQTKVLEMQQELDSVEAWLSYDQNGNIDMSNLFQETQEENIYSQKVDMSHLFEEGAG